VNQDSLFGAWHDPLFSGIPHSFTDAFESYDGWRSAGVPLFESEELTEKLLQIYLSLIPEHGWAGNLRQHLPIEGGIQEIAALYMQGLWLPCVERMVLAGQIDRRNDGLADFAAIPRFDKGKLSFFAARRLEKLPRGWGALPGSSAYYMTSWFDPSATPGDKRERGFMSMINYPVSVIGDRILPLRRGKPPPSIHYYAQIALDTAAALSVVADFRNLWCVETEEDVVGSAKIRTPLRLGVNATLVKSLFYARSTPLTEAGRKRPILHWVRSHQRRLAAGVDVDIAKHLRGIVAFEMAGFPFRITQPTRGRA
jgi:hypothetical protein